MVGEVEGWGMKRSDKKPKPVPVQPVEDQNVYQVRMAEWLKAFGEAFGFEPSNKLKESARRLVDHYTKPKEP